MKRTRSKRTWSSVGCLAIAGLLAFSCASVQEIEQQDTGSPSMDFQNPAAAEGQLELDNQLCWEQSNASETTAAEIRQAHEACMAKQGWTRP